MNLCEECSADARYCGHKLTEPKTHALYRAAVAADEAFSAALVAYYGAAGAPVARYMPDHASPVVKAAMLAVVEANDAYRAACQAGKL